MTRCLDDVSCPGGKGESGRPSRYTPDKMSRSGGGGVLEKYLGRGELLKV